MIQAVGWVPKREVRISVSFYGGKDATSRRQALEPCRPEISHAQTASATELTIPLRPDDPSMVPTRFPQQGTVNLTSLGQDEASRSEDQAAVTSAHTVNDRARNIR